MLAARRGRGAGRELEVLGVVDEHVAPARRDPRAHVRLVAQEGDGAQEQVAEVQRALLAQHPVMGLVEAGELALALGALVALREGGGPARDLVGRDHRLLEAVDAGDDRRQQGRRVALEVVDLEGELVDALEQHREPVGRRDRDDERIEPGLERLVAQQPRAEAVHGVDGELLEAALELVLHAGAQRVGGRLRGGEREDLLASAAGAGAPATADPREGGAFAAARDAVTTGRPKDGASCPSGLRRDRSAAAPMGADPRGRRGKARRTTAP